MQEEANPFRRWSPMGTTPTVRCTRSKQGVSFYGALSLNTKHEIVELMDWQDSKHSILYLEAIKHHYAPLLAQEEQRIQHAKQQGNKKVTRKKILLVWDKASHHRSREVKEWLKKNPHVFELLMFPTCSAELNPQEHVWKAMRADFSAYIGFYTFKEIIDRACRFLKTTKFDYKFC